MARKGQQQIEALHLAARTGDLQKVRWRLDRGLTVDTVVDAGDSTALMHAAEAGQIEAVRLLLDLGANVNHQDGGGSTALMAAATDGQVDVVRLLLERGAHVNHQSHSDWTALMLAAPRGHRAVISLLLEYGADVTLKNCVEETALVIALGRQSAGPADETPEEGEARQRDYDVSVQLLSAAHPDGETEVARWHAAQEEGERWWARSFRRLYHALEQYDGACTYQEVLEPFLPHALETLETLQQYRRLNTPENPYELQLDDLWQLYALNRVNDFLLLGFQAGVTLDREPPFPSEAYRSCMRQGGPSRLAGWQGPEITLEEYERFFAALGFRSFGRLDYCPFFHEIVEVVEDDACDARVQIEHVFWPGLLFGRLLFSRAGVRVRCSPTLITKEIAERSPIYFTYWRWRREAEDLSYGWGHNSQWGTKPRRDYIEAGRFNYNVDGRYYLDESYRQQQVENEPEREPDALALDEKIELLTNRCFVRTPVPEVGSYPYADRYSEPVSGLSSLPRELLE